MSYELEDLDEEALKALVERCLTLLGVQRRAFAPRLHDQILAIAQAWSAGRLFETLSDKPSAARAKLRLVGRRIVATLQAIEDLTPEYVAAISVAPESSAYNLVSSTVNALSDLYRQIVTFDRNYDPKMGGTKSALDEAVRALIALLASESLDLPKIRQGRDAIEPKLLNKEAQAIGLLLQGIDPSLSNRTLANKISAVLQGKPAVESHLLAIFEAQSDPSDAGLLRTKKGPQIC